MMMIFTIILLVISLTQQCSGHSQANDHSHSYIGNVNGDASSVRHDIASISETEVNKSRMLRQAYDNALSYSEIVPSNNRYHGEFDNSGERNSTDNRKPAFYACKDYAPKVKEEQQLNTFVIKVDAKDPDEYDKITYSFEKAANDKAKFRINGQTGEITTYYRFDRDEPIREKEVRRYILSNFNFFKLSHKFVCCSCACVRASVCVCVCSMFMSTGLLKRVMR